MRSVGHPISASLLLLLLSLLPAGATGAPPAVLAGSADYLVDVWDTDRGLPHYSVIALAQTRDGYLWAATNEGLVRFDGSRFQITTTANTAGFSGDFVISLLADRSGRLWAGTDHGVACLSNGRWLAYHGGQGLPRNELASRIFEDKNGTILVVVDRQLFALQEGRFVLRAPPRGDDWRGYAQSGGDVWAYGFRSLALWDGHTWNPVSLPADLGAVQGIAPARGGGLWISGERAICRYRNGSWTRPLPIPAGVDFRASILLEDSLGNLWAGDESRGILAFTKNGRVLSFARAEGIPHLQTRAMLEDAEGNIWVGTVGGGMARIKPRAIFNYGEAHGLMEPIVDSIAEESPERMLIGTYGGGLVRFLRDSARFTPPLLTPDGRRGARELSLSVLTGPAGTWGVTFDDGLFRLRANAVEAVPNCALQRKWTSALLRGSDGALWMATEDGLASCREGVLTRYGPESGLPEGAITALAEEPDGSLLAGGTAGIFRGRAGRFARVGAKGMAATGRIVALYADARGGIWIAAKGRGLHLLRGDRAIPVWPLPGMPYSITITSIMEDDAGRFWLPTSTQGLVAVARTALEAVAAGKTERVRYLWLRKGDGLDSNDFRADCHPAAIKASDGTLWFATMRGVAVVYPNRLRESTWIPPVHIQSVSVDGLPVPATETITIPAGSRRLEIDCGAPMFSSPQQIRFEYRLDGFDGNWTESSLSSASYSGLRPGNYVFHVRAGTAGGPWNEQGARIRLHVLHFFWETTWFGLVVLFSLTAFTGGLVHRYNGAKLARQSAQIATERGLRQDLERVQSILRISEERFSKAFRSSPFPIAICTLRDRSFADANDAFLRALGCTPDQLIGRSLGEFESSGGAAGLDSLAALLDRAEEVRGIEIPFVTRTGKTICMLTSAVPIELDGRPCLLIAANDITEHKRLEEQLAEAQKLESLGRLAGGVAHDFNNLLTVINGYTEMLLDQAEDGSSDRDFLTEIHRAGEHASALTGQLLSFSRKQLTAPRALSLNQQVQEVTKLLQRLLGENISIVTVFGRELDDVMADPGQINQVLMNLAVNARDAMPSGGRLTIETCNLTVDAGSASAHPEVPPGAYVLLTVSDTGFGMDAEVRASIFEPFFTTKPSGKGTGLGLATVHGIVRQSAGWITVSSQRGKGTTFFIYLPRAAAAASTASTVPAAPLAEPSGDETILLVEDQLEVREIARRSLASAGYRIIEAHDGASALERSAAFPDPIHLLLTDVVMPGMDGVELAARLVAARSAMRVLYMSGYTDRAAIPGNPEVSCIAKPFTPVSLIRKVRETLGQTLS